MREQDQLGRRVTTIAGSSPREIRSATGACSWAAYILFTRILGSRVPGVPGTQPPLPRVEPSPIHSGDEI